MIVYKYKLIVDGQYANKDKQGAWTSKRREQYHFNDFSEVIALRVKDSLPIDHEVVVALKNKGRAYKYFGENVRFFFKIEETSKKFQAHYERLKK